MKLRYLNTVLILSFGLFCVQSVTSQVFTDSNLPIIIINTENSATIPDDPRIFATMTIIKRPDGSRNYLTDVNTEEFIDYSGNISIETRGFSSQFLPKKPYGFTTLEADLQDNDNVKLLDMPSENDWILNSFAYDDSMMRDYISYNIARQMGKYAVKLEYCEVVVNGDYKGLYALSEKIKRDGDRVDIAKLDDDESTFPEITGGYIIETDRVDNGVFGWFGPDVAYLHEKPNHDDITTEQSSYIESVFTDLYNDAQDSNIVSGYPSIIDVSTFVDFMLMSEISSNVDSYELSTFYHKDRGGKLRAGPVWDYNLTYGNDLFQFNFDRSFTDVWQFDNDDNEGAQFWKDLFNNTEYKCYLARRFDELSQPDKAFNYDYISGLIDSIVLLISEAVAREDQLWNTIDDFSGEIADMKTWIQDRILWMQNNIGEFSACSTVDTPSLVITKINYNPEETDMFTESDDLEFIEITNNSAEIIDLTGVFFSELGISYQFPEGSTIAANEAIFLAGDSDTFQNKFGEVPFDEFRRDLSNKRQNLVLSDAFGNIIDEVEYLDDSPWPEEADGDGYYLELSDINSDNALASNWNAALEANLSVNDFNTDSVYFNVYPNPADEKLTINSTQTIEQIIIYNLVGQRVKTLEVNFKSGDIDISELRNGAYFLYLKVLNGANVTKKIFKK